MSLLTRRFPTILGLLLLIGGVLGAIFYFQGLSKVSSPELVPTKVRITNVSDNKFSVSWVTKTPTTGSLEYGGVGEKLTTPAKDERDTGEPAKYLTHHVTVDGLQPNTQYAFRILGDNSSRFDNNGSPYLTATGPVIASTPPSQNFYGNVVLPSKQSADGAIVYLTLPGGSTASTIVGKTGNYAFTLSTIRSSDLRTYVQFDPSATIANLTVESGDLQSTAAVSLANSAPVPTITLGQNTDFLNAAQAPTVAELVPGSSPTPTPEAASIFNVEPLSEPDINAVTTGSVTLLNPKDPGETLTTLRPEFRGTGPAGLTLSIAITGQKAISDTVQVATDGTWSWAPVIDLKTGKQTITVSYSTSGGSTQKITREFTISTSGSSLDPAFVSSPSASTTTRASASPSVRPSASATSSATPRAAMPDTSEGTPVTGVIENTLLTSGIGIVIMIVGVALLAL